MNWLASWVRIVGASFPGASSAVQLQTEIDSRKIQTRLRQLEDPISSLHPDVRVVSEQLYGQVRETNRSHFELADTFYVQYARVLGLLEARGHVTATHTLGRRFGGGLTVSNPGFMLYIAALYEEPEHLARFTDLIDKAEVNTWLNGGEISQELDLPLPVVRAMFEILQQQGRGILSGEVGTANLRLQA